MTTKLFTATHRATRHQGLVIKQKGNWLFIDPVDAHGWWYVYMSDLAELKPFPIPCRLVEADAVVIEGFSVAYLADMADFAEHVCKVQGYQNSERDFKRLREQLREQLSTPADEPAGEAKRNCEEDSAGSEFHRSWCNVVKERDAIVGFVRDGEIKSPTYETT